MLITGNDGRCLVECHIPLSLIMRIHNWHYSGIDQAFQEWKTAVLAGDLRRCGRINFGPLAYYVVDVGNILHSHGYAGGKMLFEMYVKPIFPYTEMNNLDNVLNDQCGHNFFLVDLEMLHDNYGAPPVVKKFLTTTLVVKSFPKYEAVMDDIFSGLIPFFEYRPENIQLPTTSLS